MAVLQRRPEDGLIPDDFGEGNMVVFLQIAEDEFLNGLVELIIFIDVFQSSPGYPT